MKNIDINDVKSILELKEIYVKNFNFVRVKQSDDGTKTRFQFEKNIDKSSENTFFVSLIAKIYTSEYELELTIVGEFAVDDFESNEILIYKNSLAILFPYLRSELTILTTHPNMNPIILPPININAFFDMTQD